ncbi:MAG: hypothetical protein IPN30_08910 [Flavobacteriales bacterium]|nr:hypothetical protein [Flavobacteriales bacterium]
MEHWIGIDVSSATLDFALLDGKGTHLESVQIEKRPQGGDEVDGSVE